MRLALSSDESFYDEEWAHSKYDFYNGTWHERECSQDEYDAFLESEASE